MPINVASVVGIEMSNRMHTSIRGYVWISVAPHVVVPKVGAACVILQKHHFADRDGMTKNNDNNKENGNKVVAQVIAYSICIPLVHLNAIPVWLKSVYFTTPMSFDSVGNGSTHLSFGPGSISSVSDDEAFRAESPAC